MTASRPLLIALIVSAALNLFLIGGIVGALSMRAQVPKTTVAALAAAPRPPLWTAGQGLSPEHRQGFRQTLREAGRRNQPAAKASRLERRAVWIAMQEPNFDAAAAKAHLAKARDLDAEVRANVDAAVVDFAAGLPADERAELADGLRAVQGPRIAAPAKR
jgi:uncharacterized membrane protein